MLNLDQYIKIDQIGAGSFGVVYKIKTIQTGEFFAAKISLISFDEKAIQQNKEVKREVNILSIVNHPSILKFIGYSPTNFQNQSNPVIITEFIQNGSLKNIISSDRDYQIYMGWNDTRKLINIYGIASALAFLHSNKIIHRDLKPANILMDNFLCPKIADFGLSKIIHTNADSMSSESGSDAKGTPIYMAPEIWQNSEYSEASDVYSFGLIVYEIMTNEMPFKNCKNSFAVMKKVTSGERPQFTVQIPHSYQLLITKCWSQDPLNRPSFKKILEIIKTDEGFITKDVDATDFKSYIDYMDQYKEQHDPPNPIIPICEFIKYDSKTFDKIFYIGDADELFHEGERHENGYGTPIDKQRASRYYKRAVEKGHIDAKFKYGWMLLNGIGVHINKTKASEYFKEAADKGQVDAMYNYAWMLSQGDVIPVDQEEASKYYKMAAEKGNVNAMNNYAVRLLNGTGVEMNKKESLKYFKKAADQGQVRAMYSYGWILKYGEGTSVNKEEASLYFKMSADKGYDEAMKSYARKFYTGDGIQMDRKEANKYFQMAAPKRANKEWYLLDSLDDFTILDECYKKLNIKKGFINSTNQPIIAKFPLDNDIDQLKQECNNLIKCSHPSIQKVVGLFIANNNSSSCLITPYCVNGSLDDISDLLIDESNDENNSADENKSSLKTAYKIIFSCYEIFGKKFNVSWKSESIKHFN